MLDINYEKIHESIMYNHIKSKPIDLDFHLHDGFEIYFLILGDVDCFVEKKIYPLQYGDLIITNNHEIHKLCFKSDKYYERIYLQFNPSTVNPFSSPNFDLLSCFLNRPLGEYNKVSLNPVQLKGLLDLFNKMEKIKPLSAPGSEILMLNYLIELLVYINVLYKDVPFMNLPAKEDNKLTPILNYIDKNLDGDLSLNTLEKIFYIDKYYLSKLFKKSIGNNLHEYIIFKRISKAKILLSEGLSVTDTCSKCGFNDYSNFLKTFKKTIGVSPGKFRKI
jgi:AraC-like DNA-binding protein